MSLCGQIYISLNYILLALADHFWHNIMVPGISFLPQGRQSVNLGFKQPGACICYTSLTVCQLMYWATPPYIAVTLVLPLLQLTREGGIDWRVNVPCNLTVTPATSWFPNARCHHLVPVGTQSHCWDSHTGRAASWCLTRGWDSHAGTS